MNEPTSVSPPPERGESPDRLAYLRHPTLQGDRVAFVADDDLWTVPAGGGIARRLTAGLSEPSTPCLSPDGRWLAFVFWTGARPDINVQPFPGPGLRRQIAEGGTEPVWSRDGRELFFRSRRAPGAPSGRPSDEGIFASPFDLVRGEASGQPVQLFRGRFAHNERNLPMYDVTPDGRRFVIVMAGEEEYAPVNLNVVVNLGDELRRRVPAK